MTGIERIAAERQRQIEKEGWTPAHDDSHVMGELADAAGCYANFVGAQARGASPEEFSADWLILEGEWPFEAEWWKPSDNPIRNLEKAGALIAGEIDRLQRAEEGR